MGAGPPDYDESYDDLTERFEAAYMGDSSNETQLIIGLDFGTTYSGVAYAFSNEPNKIHAIDSWPGGGGRTYAKCPTLIDYKGSDFKWGFEVDRYSSSCIEGIKLWLDPDQPKPRYAPSLKVPTELGRLRKKPIDVASDYISAIYQYAISVIEKGYPKDYLSVVPRQYVLSVPAVWSDKAKDATLRAARNAGINPVRLVKEPEAGALFTIHSLGNKGLRVGDALVLCDAGGGTVDLVSYEISSLRPFQLKELTIGTGALAGSLLINHRFGEWVKDVVGDAAYSNLSKGSAYRLAMRAFEDDIKPGFTARDQPVQYVSFPGADLEDNLAKGLKRDAIAVTGNALHGIFEPIVSDIDRLVKEQVKDARLARLGKGQPNAMTVKAIFMVGGFGSNRCLFDRITRSNPGIQVIQPNDAWSAIVRGAVMFQLPTEAQVVTSIAPKHYGVSALCIYDEDADAGEDKSWDSQYEQWRVEKMTWYIEKGDDLLRARRVEFSFFRTFEPNPDREALQTRHVLLECEAGDKPLHPRDDIVRKNCTLKTDLSKVPASQFEKKKRISRSDGSLLEWWEIHYKLMVTIQSGPMLFSIHCGGKEYGQANAEY